MALGKNPGASGADGLLALLHRDDKKLLELWKGLAEKHPCVNLKTSVQPGRDNVVRTDHAGGAKRLVSALIKEGFRRFAWLSLTDTEYARERRNGFSETLIQAGLDFESWSPLGKNPSFAPLPEGATDGDMERIFSGSLGDAILHSPRPEIICAENDRVAWNLYRFFRMRGVQVPGDLALTGFDNRDFRFEPWGTNILTSVRQDNAAIASAGVRLLHEVAAGQRKRFGQTILLPGEIVLRHSTGRIGSRMDSFRRQVEHWLERHACEAGDPAVALAGVLGLDRRYLLEKYRDVFKEPLVKSVARLRIHRAEALLRTTALPVTEIWREVGYENQQSFNRHFRTLTRRSPNDLRK